MMDITILSQSLRSKYKEFEVLLNQNELAIILIQDMGNVGPDGPQELRQALTPHTIITNTTPTNKARSTGIILHKNWEIVKEQKHESRSRSQNCEYLDVRDVRLSPYRPRRVWNARIF